ncbi:MAG: cro/C1-type protein [Chloroflexota bacterium]|nr:cro/C1-type protein [Chloroflexota bacterium]
MSLGDYLRLLRARQRGITPWEIEEATGLTKGLYRQMEQRYRAMGDDDSISILADFYGIPFDGLRWRLDWPRKALSRTLLAMALDQRPLTLHLWNGQVATGTVVWWDLGAVALDAGADDPLIVQRHAVERWSPRLADAHASHDVAGEDDAEE